MRIINGKEYQLGLLDTNIVSEILTNRSVYGKNFVVYSIANKVIPCISIWTILEIRKKKELYDQFLEFFSIYPFFLTQSPMFVFADEIANYPNPSKVDPLLMPFTPLEQNPDAHLNTFLEKLFNKPDVIDAERNWNGRWGNDALKSMLNLKSNFQPTGQYYSASDARRFLYEGVPQYVLAQNPAWMKKRIIDMNQALDINAFPSVKTAFYTVFYRFYAEQRKPERQDVFDILISSIAPYLDMVIVENFQAEIFRKVKRKDAMFKKMEIATLKDFR